MKFMLNAQKVASATPSMEAFDFESAWMDINNRFEEVLEASKTVKDAERDIAECAEVMSDCKKAVAAFESLGITPVTMSLFNDGNELDKTFGLEALDIASVESLEQPVKDARVALYKEKLTASAEEADQGFVAALKRFWQAVKDFFMKLFGSNATIIKALTAAKEALANPAAEATISAIPADKAKKMLEVCKAIEAEVKNFKADLTPPAETTKFSTTITSKIEELGFKAEGKKITGAIKEEYKKTSKTVKELGYDKGADSMLGEVTAQLDNAAIKNLTKEIDTALKTAISYASKTEDNSKEIAARLRTNASCAMKTLNLHAKLVRDVAISLLAVARAKAPKKEGAAA